MYFPAAKFKQTLFGLAVGLAARFLLPGHFSMSLLLSAALSGIGSVSGCLAARYLLPAGALRSAGFAVSALGALMTLLIYAVAAQ